MILASIDRLLRDGHRSSDPRQFFLQVLQGYCESWVAAQGTLEAEETAG